MRRFLLLAGIVASLSAMMLQAQTPAPKPGPEHQKLNVWVGDWTYESEAQATPFGPAGKSTGKITVRPILGGFFVEFRGEDTGPAGTSHWFEVDRYDALTKTYSWSAFGSDGSFETATYSFDGATVKYSGTVTLGDKPYSFRGTAIFGADFKSWSEKREVSADGKTWIPRFQNKVTKTNKP